MHRCLIEFCRWQIKQTVTHIFHNAWRVDFNLSLPSFESSIAGVRKLIDFACATQYTTRLFFTSSISATAKWDVSLGRVPEDVILNPQVAASNGYGASKFVAEQAGLSNADYTQLSLMVATLAPSEGSGKWTAMYVSPAGSSMRPPNRGFMVDE